MHDRQMDAEYVEQRSLGATLAAGALTGTTAGVSNAVAGQVIGALAKPKDAPPPPKES